MKPKLITSILLFISAYSPLFLILIVKDFNFESKSKEQISIINLNYFPKNITHSDSIKIVSIIENSLSKFPQNNSEVNKYFNHPTIDIVVLCISILSIVLLFLIFSKIRPSEMEVTILDVKNRSLDIINYIIPYLFCAFDIDISKPEDLITVSFFLLILFILTINTQSIFINPILALRGYAFYDIEYKFGNNTDTTIVISRQKIKKGNMFNLKSLTPFLYLINSDKNEIENGA
ncbi:MAG: hypothetical protein Q7W45_17640 [Bacteroidota bacterium]|nr:hypothetical protein [Bacteroidota bacterium]MDP3145694.1 hypothetical protein [Bacteroidota bacterium]